MDRFTSKDLMASSKRVTRSHLKQLKSIFPFLELPAEMRNMIYKYCTNNPQRLLDFFDKYYERLMAARAKPQPWTYYNTNTPRMLAYPNKKAPAVFLLNKQISKEAIHYFFNSKRNITFNHGMLEMRNIEEFISPNVLLNITSLIISDSGHNEIIQLQNPGVTESLPCSWNGYMRLITQLGVGFSQKGHKLKTVTIDFSRDTRLPEHLLKCAYKDHIGGFKDQFHSAINPWKGVRGVGCVTLIGLDPSHAAYLKARMESSPVNFADMPLNVRKIIYGKALGWKDISHAIMRAAKGWTPDKLAFPYPGCSTPTVLLMNKVYTTEALKVLDESRQTLILDLPADHNIKPGDMPGLSRFLSRDLLKNVRSIVITMRSRDWLESLDHHFLISFAAHTSKLESFELVFLDDQFEREWPEYPDRLLRERFGKLTKVRALKNVTISGVLPICFSDQLAKIMTGPSHAAVSVITRVLRRGAVIDLDKETRIIT